MTCPSESSVVRAIIRAIQDQGADATKNTGVYTERGRPDLFACFHGRFVAIEVKTKEGRLTPLQAAQLKRWRSVGARAGVATSPEEALRICGDVLPYPCPHCGSALRVLDELNPRDPFEVVLLCEQRLHRVVTTEQQLYRSRP